MSSLSDDYDDHDDFFEMIRKYLGINSDMFDVDFLFLPTPSLNSSNKPKDKNSKGFKVTYHFEAGMDKPEVKIEGDFDQKKFQEYLKRFKIGKDFNPIQLARKSKIREVDAKNLQIEPELNTTNIKAIEPYSDVAEYEDCVEIVVETPGVEKGHFLLSLNEDGKKLKINAESQIRKFLKTIKLPFNCTMDNYSFEINNGIAIIKLNKIKRN